MSFDIGTIFAEMGTFALIVVGAIGASDWTDGWTAFPAN